MRRASALFAGVLAAAACGRTAAPLGLAAAPKSYSPALSSTVGIKLDPILPPGAPSVGDVVRWRADYGYFVSWGSPDYRVVALGSDVRRELGPVYWTYDPKDTGTAKQDATITAEVTNADRVVARGTLRVGWDKDVARVKD
jgi:hypothetical protein